MTATEQNGLTSAAGFNGPPGIATRSLAGVLVPDSPLISRAIEHASGHHERKVSRTDE